MIPVNLQRNLKNEFEELFKDTLLKNTKGEDSEVNVFEQFLPVEEESKYENQKSSEPYPYVVVRLADGSDGDECEDCRVQIIIGIYDDNTDFKGYQDVMMIIEKIKQHLRTKRYFGQEKFEFKRCSWTLHDDDLYPFFIGGIETTWAMPISSMELEDLI